MSSHTQLYHLLVVTLGSQLTHLVTYLIRILASLLTLQKCNKKTIYMEGHSKLSRLHIMLGI